MTKQRKHHAPPPRRPASGFSTLTQWKQDLVCIAILFLLTVILFNEVIVKDAALAEGGDTAAAIAYEKAGKSIEESEGIRDVLWMPFFFSGMPTFGNFAYVPRTVSYVQNYLVEPVLDLLYLNREWSWIIVFHLLSGIFMYLLARYLGFQSLLALFAAIVFMLSPYAIGLGGEGHGSKLMTLAYLPLVFLCTMLVFDRRDILSVGLLAASVGTMMLNNHVQIAYYAFMLIGAYALFRIAVDARQHGRSVSTGALLFAVALVLGLCMSAYNYLSAQEYAQYSIRGGGTTGTPGGLAWEYATNWSWHPLELFTLIIPGFFGFQLPYYWGPIEPWTNSTVYVGLLPVLLTVVAIAGKRTSLIWFFALASVVVLLLSFGRTFPLVYQAAFSVLPYFDKFRAPAMILHLIAFTFAILGTYGLRALLESGDGTPEGPSRARTARTTLIAAGILILGLVALKGMLSETLSGFMFLKSGEAEQFRQQYAQQASQVIAQVKAARFTTFWTDSLTFAILLAAAAGAALAFAKGKLRATSLLIAFLGILIIDLYIVDSKLVDPKPSTALAQSFVADMTVTYLKEQPGPFRVFPLGNLFADNTYAYHGLQSIGGYSPAKLKIYQAVLDSCLFRGPDPAFPINMNVVNMLNVHYFVVPGLLPENMFPAVHSDQQRRVMTYRNPGALPRAFLVQEAVTAASDAEVFRTLNSTAFDPRRTAILQQPVPADLAPPSPGDTVRLMRFGSHRIVLESRTAGPALLVLSEVYYPAGWKAFVDGTETEIFRTNSILRSVRVPAGTHEVVFEFAPAVYAAGFTITNIAWAVSIALILLGLWKTPAVRARLRRRSSPAER